MVPYLYQFSAVMQKRHLSYAIRDTFAAARVIPNVINFLLTCLLTCLLTLLLTLLLAFLINFLLTYLDYQVWQQMYLD